MKKSYLGILVLAGAMAVSGCATKGGRSGGFGDGSSKDGGIGLGTLKRVYFGFDDSSVTEEAVSVLKSNAKTMQSSPSMKVLVEGHCDERGSNEYNISLGERRAKAVVDYMVSLGVGRSRFETKSWGEEKPLTMEKSDEAYATNRRGEFVILKK